MEMQSRPDLFAGLFFILVGLAFLTTAQSYDLGSPARMGPGYFPSAVAGVLILLGTAIAIQGLVAGADAIRGDSFAFSWTAAGIILGSAVLFAVALSYGGLILAVIVSVLASSAAVGRPFHPQTLVLAVGLTAFSVVLFVLLLGLPIPLWPRV
jgi:hypothetical protein